MFSGTKKKKFKKLKMRLREDVMGELTVRIMKTNMDTDILENVYLDRLIMTKKKAIILTCPMKSTTVQSLKERLAGITDIPARHIHLYFKGAYMKDENPIPIDAFEYIDYKESDEDVFKPRIYMEVTFNPEDDDAPETSKQRALRVQLEIDRAEALERQKEEDERLAKEVEIEKERQEFQKLQQKIAKKEARHRFNLEEQMRKINCELFFPRLRDAGYEEEGAFAHVTDEVLAGYGLWIPKLSRIRILSLRDAFLRKQETIHAARHVKVDVSHMGRERGGADGVVYNNKKELEDAWKRQKEAEEARLWLLEHGPQPKPHAPELQAKIDKLRRDNERCEEGMLIKDAYKMIYDPAEFCCRTHQLESERQRERFLDMRLRGQMAEFENAIENADKNGYNNGYISREMLQLLARIQCDKILRAPSHRILHPQETLTIARITPYGPSDRSPEASPSKIKPKDEMTEEEERVNYEERLARWNEEKANVYSCIDKLLNRCIMDHGSQARMMDWGGRKEVVGGHGAIPTERYDIPLFINSMRDILKQVDRDRYMSTKYLT